MTIKTLEAKWLDPECWDGCQSLVWKHRAEKAEQELAALKEKLLVKNETLELLPPPTDTRSRLSQFKELLIKCYTYLNNASASWDASDSAQLSKFIKANPELTKEEFRNWLWNYAESENINPSWRLRRVISHITEYRNGPLNEYGRPLVQKRRIL